MTLRTAPIPSSSDIQAPVRERLDGVVDEIRRIVAFRTSRRWRR
jgi:hypothetical protein